MKIKDCPGLRPPSRLEDFDPSKCETVGDPLSEVALYGTQVLGLSQVA